MCWLGQEKQTKGHHSSTSSSSCCYYSLLLLIPSPLHTITTIPHQVPTVFYTVSLPLVSLYSLQSQLQSHNPSLQHSLCCSRSIISCQSFHPIQQSPRSSSPVQRIPIDRFDPAIVYARNLYYDCLSFLQHFVIVRAAYHWQSEIAVRLANDSLSSDLPHTGSSHKITQ